MPPASQAVGEHSIPERLPGSHGPKTVETGIFSGPWKVRREEGAGSREDR